MDISRIHEKCANFVFLHSNYLKRNSVKQQLYLEVPKVPKKITVGISVLNSKVRTVLRYFGTGKMLNKASKIVEMSSADITTAAK